MTELLPCPLCASTNVSDGICFVGDRSTSEPAIRCADCGCRATLAAWTYRASEDGKCYGSTAVSKTVSAGSTPAPSAIPVCAQGAMPASVKKAFDFAYDLLGEFGNRYGSSESSGGREIIGVVDEARSKIRQAEADLAALTEGDRGCGTPGCTDPNCTYGSGTARCQRCGHPLPAPEGDRWPEIDRELSAYVQTIRAQLIEECAVEATRCDTHELFCMADPAAIRRDIAMRIRALALPSTK